MPAGHRPSINYYSINKNGKIRSTSGNDKDTEYDFLWGVLVGIDRMKDSYEGDVHHKWHFKLEDPLHGSMDVLQIGEKSSAARGLIMSLISIPGIIRQIKITPFNKNHDGKTYTNVWLECREHEADPWENSPEWTKQVVDHMPEQKEVKLSDGSIVLDDGERRKYIMGLAARIKKTKINAPKTNGLADGERMDPATGEVMDHTAASEAAYREPAPEKVKQIPEEIHTDFDDMDDDLPF